MPTSAFWLQAAAWLWSESCNHCPAILHVGLVWFCLVCQTVSMGWSWISLERKETRSSTSKTECFPTLRGDIRVLSPGWSFGQLWTTSMSSSNPPGLHAVLMLGPEHQSCFGLLVCSYWIEMLATADTDQLLADHVKPPSWAVEINKQR